MVKFVPFMGVGLLALIERNSAFYLIKKRKRKTYNIIKRYEIRLYGQVTPPHKLE